MMHYGMRVSSLLLAFAAWLSGGPACWAGDAANYAVVVSRATYDREAWADVVSTLVDKHAADVLVYDQGVMDVLPQLQQRHPRYTCFVARYEEATRQMVADVHALVRQYDDDPYADTFWGILTGYDAAGALRIAGHDTPLTVRKVASGTDIALEMCQEGICYDELVEHKMVQKQAGGEAEQTQGPGDTTAALVACLNDYKADLFVTSGHATERDWMIGFRYRNGSFRSQAGQMTGVDTKGVRHPVHSPNPKVYLPIGNCLMGHIDGPDAMALAWMNCAGVHQMIGYTVPTWYGYMGWGCLDYFVEQPGRYTFAEAFLANHHALVHRLSRYFPEQAEQQGMPGQVMRPSSVGQAAKDAGLTSSDAAGLLFDRDVVAFYGDPQWSARMADGPLAWGQELERDGDVYRLTITPERGESTFAPINTNGSQRGGRPIIQFFERRLSGAEVLEGQELAPVITDDFILIPNPQTCDPTRRYVVRFRAEEID